MTVGERTAYEVCRSCRGSGLQNGMEGPVPCCSCSGQSIVRVRDEHGRFATVECT